MSKKGVAIGIGVTVAVIVVIAVFTNIFELARPAVDKSINVTGDTASQVQGKDVVAGAKIVASDIKNITSQIKIKNPYP
ncbi:MAG TPA: hypothetical protein VFG24_09360 [Nitrosopumilaceae archaeon]|nr:hypothetical protein [Nitrosopumilaceae archaeon]